MANKRTQLINKISGLTDNKEVIDAVNDFLDDMEIEFYKMFKEKPLPRHCGLDTKQNEK